MGQFCQDKIAKSFEVSQSVRPNRVLCLGNAVSYGLKKINIETQSR